MDARLKEKALAKVPEWVAKIKDYEGEGDLYFLTVRKFSVSGSPMGEDRFVVDEDDLMTDVVKAKMLHCKIEVTDTVVTVTRYYKNGCYAVAEYRPAFPEGGENEAYGK